MPKGVAFFVFMEIIIGCLLLLILVQGYVSYKERGDLVDRLMAKDLEDYKIATDEEDNIFGDEEDDDDDLMPLDDAREEIEKNG